MEKKITPNDALTPAQVVAADSRYFCLDDAAFAVLYMCGFTAAAAYRIVYGSKGKNSSVVSLASRRLREANVQHFIHDIKRLYLARSIRLRTEIPCVINCPYYYAELEKNNTKYL